jgi:hypothetical protein
MHPTLFDYWWRSESARVNESARVKQRIEMAAAVQGARLETARGRSTWAVRVPAKLGSRLRGAEQVSAGVLHFGQPAPRRLSLSVIATSWGKRG